MPGHGGGDHVEGAGRRQPLGDPPHAVILEVLDQGVVGGQGAGPHLADPGPAAPAGRSTVSW